MSNFRQSDDASIGIRSFGVTFPSGQITPPRSSEWHQLIYASRGVMTVRTADSAWVVPPHRAVWIPASVVYRVEMSGVVALRAIYVRERRDGTGPRACTVVNVTPLLRELILRTVQLGALDDRVPEQKRLARVILDEIRTLRAVPLQLPLPRDARAVRFVDLLNADSSPQPAVPKILRACGASRRTVERIFRQETAMSFGQWLRRHKLLWALRRLAAGETVAAVADELGYNGPSAFIAMFRRELGRTPGRYFEA